MDIIPENRCMEYEELGLDWLSFASGCTDVLSFLKLGEVFTSAMAGNIAFVPIAIGRCRTLFASRSLSALFGFMPGVESAMISAPFDAEQTARHRLRRLLLIETVLLGDCAALWSVSDNPVHVSAFYAVILLSAVSMGIHGAVASRINVSDISTTVFTSVLIHLVMSFIGMLPRPATCRLHRHASGLKSGHLPPMAAAVVWLECWFLTTWVSCSGSPWHRCCLPSAAWARP